MSQSVDLDFDEALYLYTLLRQCDGVMMPDFFPIEHQLNRAHEMTEEVAKQLGKTPEELHTEHIMNENEWRDCQFYARIVPKLLSVYPEIYRMREQ